GSKLLNLSLTESGRIDGMPITWNRIFTLCPSLVELRTSATPFIGVTEGSLSSPLVYGIVAQHLRRLCFVHWEFSSSLGQEDTQEDGVGTRNTMRLESTLDQFFHGIGGSYTPSL